MRLSVKISSSGPEVLEGPYEYNKSENVMKRKNRAYVMLNETWVNALMSKEVVPEALEGTS